MFLAMLQGYMSTNLLVCAKVHSTRFTLEPFLLHVDMLPNVGQTAPTLKERFAARRANK